MLPPGANLGARGDLDDGAVLELEVGVAGEIRVVDVLDGRVAVRSPDTLELALVHAVDRHLLEDGVRADGGRQGDEGEELHIGCCVGDLMGERSGEVGLKGTSNFHCQVGLEARPSLVIHFGHVQGSYRRRANGRHSRVSQLPK